MWTIRIHTALAFVLTLSVLLGGPSRPAHAQSTLYDDFSGGQLDPDRWVGEQVTTQATTPAHALELVREIRDQGLFMSHRVVGETSADTGSQSSANLLRVPGNVNESITAMQYDVTVIDYAVTACPVPESAPSFTDAQAVAYLFNDGSSLGSNDRTGDVGAAFDVFRASYDIQPPDVVRVQANLYRCGDPGCIGGTFLGTVNFQDAPLGATLALRWEWDKQNKQVNFEKIGEPVQSIRYTQNDIRPPVRTLKGLSVHETAANCTVPPRPVAQIDVLYGNVFVNP